MRYEFYTPAEIELMEKALKCIETIAEDRGMFGIQPEDDPWGEVYRLAHAGRSPSCRESHQSWENDINKLYREFEVGSGGVA